MGTMNILLVDDDKLTARYLSFELAKYGYNVRYENDGWRALHLLSEKRISLLITDLIMPELGGISMINLIKNFTARSIPVIIISSLKPSMVNVRTTDLGVIDYFVKPVNINTLVDRIEGIRRSTPEY